MTEAEMRYALLTAAVLFSLDSAFAAGPASKWGHDEETQQWFKSLKNPIGTPCCDYVDGHRLEDVDWRGPNPDGSYDVNNGRHWINVDKDHIVKGRNIVGYAILWENPTLSDNPDYPGVYCFLPGTGS
jgi:hypothetical protein